MEIISREIKLNKDIINQYFPEDTMFFDIETLGLSASRSPVYLIGYMYGKDKKVFITLLFSESSKKEEEILREFSLTLKRFKSIITFNGTTFDIPYLKTRCDKYGIDLSFDGLKHTDLFRETKALKDILSLPNYKQKTVETFLGIDREDKYNGGELIEVYKKYEITGDKDLKDLLILHNFEDIEGMGKILPILSYQAIRDGRYQITDVSMDDDHLTFDGILEVTLPRPLRIHRPGLIIGFEGQRFSGSFSLFSGNLRLYLENYKNYVYLKSENKIIPKELATTIKKEDKCPATRDTAFTSIEGSFIPVTPDTPKKKRVFKSLFNKSKGHYICKLDSLDPCEYVFLCKKESPGNPELSDRIYDLLCYTFS